MTIWTPGSNTRVMKENKAIVQEIWQEVQGLHESGWFWKRLSREKSWTVISKNRFRSSHMQMFNSKKGYSKISQYLLENICVGISFLMKIQAFRLSALLKRDPNTGVFCEYWEMFKDTYSEEHLWTAAFESFPWTFSYISK